MIPPKDRLETKFIVTPGCWLWTGMRHPDGYGRMVMERKSYLAHRVAFEHYNGPIVDGLCVRHKCDNPRCVNPDHLELGTHTDNMRDKHARGRARFSDRRGTRNTQVKLTEDQVLRIREDKRTLKAIAAEYGISEASASLIRRKKNWTHL